MGLAALCQIRSLKSLTLGETVTCLPIIDDGALQALSFHPGLNSIVLRQCRKVSDHGIQALLRMKGLKRWI
jgi:hypothetical protein